MRILFVGDIVGSVGRNMVINNVARLKDELQLDLVIANGENSAHGKGITRKIYHALLNAGVDVITMGNHTYSKDPIFQFIDEAEQLVVPMNLDPDDRGQHYKVVEVNGYKVCICNVMGEVFMIEVNSSPFDCMKEILRNVEADFYFCDFHGEATSEKLAFAYYFKDDIHAVVGTHTHVQTADNRIIGNTAYISDVGMCGAYESIIGRDVNEVLTRFTTNEKTRFTVAEGEGMLNAVVIDFDEVHKCAIAIKRLQILPEKGQCLSD
ncbi:metallophosphoesterase [Erysipelotrichaceae bacterium MTC7]|nr:metallophosphoesterase [Erysipelotrichaceae bacterium MTC7]